MCFFEWDDVVNVQLVCFSERLAGVWGEPFPVAYDAPFVSFEFDRLSAGFDKCFSSRILAVSVVTDPMRPVTALIEFAELFVIVNGLLLCFLDLLLVGEAGLFVAMVFTGGFVGVTAVLVDAARVGMSNVKSGTGEGEQVKGGSEHHACLILAYPC